MSNQAQDIGNGRCAMEVGGQQTFAISGYMMSTLVVRPPCAYCLVLQNQDETKQIKAAQNLHVTGSSFVAIPPHFNNSCIS